MHCRQVLLLDVAHCRATKFCHFRLGVAVTPVPCIQRFLQLHGLLVLLPTTSLGNLHELQKFLARCKSTSAQLLVNCTTEACPIQGVSHVFQEVFVAMNCWMETFRQL